MPRRTEILAVCLVFLASVVAGCGSDSTSPENDGPKSFSRIMSSPPDQETNIMGVAVLSDGTRMVCGDFTGALHITGSPDSVFSGASPRNFVAGFHTDGSLASLETVAGTGAGIRRMARDRDDNLLLVGSFGGSGNFGGVPLTAVNGDMIFAKLDRFGNTFWVQSGSGSGNDDGTDIAAASDGNIYLTGVASGEMTVAGEDVGQSGHATGFLVKLRSDGVGVWQQTAGVSGGESACNAVATSADGSIVACGTYTSPTLDFGGVVLDHGSGTVDSFVGRFKADGTPLGSIHMQSAGRVVAVDVTTIDNDAIVTGSYDATTDFDPPGAGGAVKVNGTANAFVARYSPAGALRWVKTFRPGNNQTGLSLSPLPGGNILVCGRFETTITLGSTTLTSTGNTDVFIARLDGDGKVLSASQIGGPGEEVDVLTTTAGSTAIIAGDTGSNPVIFPDGTHRARLGIFDSYIFQQP
jgi:hypothetical protein